MSNYDIITAINNQADGIWFEKIEGFPLVGDLRSDAYKHPIQYVAKTNVREGEDDPYEGIGWSPTEALRDLLKELKSNK